MSAAGALACFPNPSPLPTSAPTSKPSDAPIPRPTGTPTPVPSSRPTAAPTAAFVDVVAIGNQFTCISNVPCDVKWRYRGDEAACSTVALEVLAGDAFLSSVSVVNAAANVYTHNIDDGSVGDWGGWCTCPDGGLYQVGDTGDACDALACVGGTAGECFQGEGAWSRNRVVCGAVADDGVRKHTLTVPADTTVSAYAVRATCYETPALTASRHFDVSFTEPPSKVPVPIPTSKPSTVPSPRPTGVPAPSPTSVPTPAPVPRPTSAPSIAPIPRPSSLPTSTPTSKPTMVPTSKPTTSAPSAIPFAAASKKRRFRSLG